VSYSVTIILREVIKMQTIDLKEAKNHLPELIEKSISGDEIIITRGGEPVVKLVAFTKPDHRQRQFGSAKGLIHIISDSDAPIEDFQDYL
jgi:prevent-host-death family protein